METNRNQDHQRWRVLVVKYVAKSCATNTFSNRIWWMLIKSRPTTWWWTVWTANLTTALVKQHREASRWNKNRRPASESEQKQQQKISDLELKKLELLKKSHEQDAEKSTDNNEIMNMIQVKQMKNIYMKVAFYYNQFLQGKRPIGKRVDKVEREKPSYLRRKSAMAQWEKWVYAESQQSREETRRERAQIDFSKRGKIEIEKSRSTAAHA